MFLRILFFILILTGVSNAHSGWTLAHEETVQKLTGPDRRIFTETLQSCEFAKNRKPFQAELAPQESLVLLGTMGDLNRAIEKSISEGFTDAFVVFRNTGGLGMYLYELLNSDGFRLAVKKCFDGSAFKENNYVANLLLLDATVKGLYIRFGVISQIKSLLRFRIGRYLLAAVVGGSIAGSTPHEGKKSWFESLKNQVSAIEAQVDLILKEREKSDHASRP